MPSYLITIYYERNLTIISLHNAVLTLHLFMKQTQLYNHRGFHHVIWDKQPANSVSDSN